MRTFIMSAAVAAIAAVSFAAPSQAGGFSIGFGGYGHHRGNVEIGFYDDGYYGGPYYYEEPTCFFKKIRKYDKWGNLKVKTIKVCE